MNVMGLVSICLYVLCICMYYMCLYVHVPTNFATGTITQNLLALMLNDMNVQWDAQYNTNDYKKCSCLYVKKLPCDKWNMKKQYIGNYNIDFISNELLEHFIEFYKRRI